MRYTPYIVVGGSRRREIALTFDDGPGPFTLREEASRAPPATASRQYKVAERAGVGEDELKRLRSVAAGRSTVLQAIGSKLLELKEHHGDQLAGRARTAPGRARRTADRAGLTWRVCNPFAKRGLSAPTRGAPHNESRAFAGLLRVGRVGLEPTTLRLRVRAA